MRLKKADSKSMWPSTFFGSGVQKAAGVEWDLGVRRLRLRDYQKDPLNLSPPSANKGTGSC